MAAAIRAVLFDKDGTLVDFEKTWLGVAQTLALAAAGGDLDGAARLLDVAGFDAGEGRFRPDSVFAAGTNAEIVALWYPELGEAERARRTESFNALTAAEGARRAVPLPGVAEAVAELRSRGLTLGVATNDSTEGARLTLAALGLAEAFAAAFGYDSVARPKPAPDPVHAFAALAGLEPRAIAVVGDNGHDLEMARAAGAGLAVGVLSGNGTRASLSPLADAVLASVADLPAFLAAREAAVQRRSVAEPLDAAGPATISGPCDLS
jgi:phosphoglycolate phosphatase